MGWLGWTEAQALDTDVNSIQIAMEGKEEMLYPELRGRGRKRVKGPSSLSSRFKSLFKEHNAQLKSRG